MSWWKRWWRRTVSRRLVSPYANFSRNIHPAPNGIEVLTVAIPIRKGVLDATEPEAAAATVSAFAARKAYGATLKRAKNGPNRGVLTLPGWSNN